MRESERGEIRVSVRGLVEFLLRSGDIDNRRQGGGADAMQEGSRVHRMIQRRMGPEYEAEVPLKYCLEAERYTLYVEGRADGILTTPEGVTIDEIKGTYRRLERMKEPVPEHLAQAKCYAYLYSLRENLAQVRIRLTYCNLETEEIRFFYVDETFESLERWFGDLIREYRRWADLQWEWRRMRRESIEDLEFPFPYREGQRSLAVQVYQTISERRKLFLEAPTGVGKTLTTLFPAVKAVGQGLADKVFYLTAKGVTRTVAEDALELLRGRGLRFRSVVLTAKEKVCFCEKTDCNPESCPYAKGHYDRVNLALYELLSREEHLSREVLERYAREYEVCPFELMLDASLFADAVLCDYNYLFDPNVRLKRFFGEGSGHSGGVAEAGNEYLFLIDEAHNLVERGREMYSAVLWKGMFSKLARSLKQTVLSENFSDRKKSSIQGQLTIEMTESSQDFFVTDTSDDIIIDADAGKTGGRTEPLSAQGLSRETDERIDTLYRSRGKRRGARSARSVLVREGYAEKLIHQAENIGRLLLEWKRECPGSRVLASVDELIPRLERFYATAGDYLEEREEERLPVREELLEAFFEVSHFLETAENLDEHYEIYTQTGEDGGFLVKLFCVNPRELLRECMGYGRASILFSATFLPVQYYKRLLGGEEEDYEVYAKSVFDQEKRALFIARDVTSKYTRRSEGEYRRIAQYISEIVRGRPGNYFVFCPSHAFLGEVYSAYQDLFLLPGQECILQGEAMNEREREAFLARFGGGRADPGGRGEAYDALIGMEIETEERDGEEARSLLGFCVLGGIFGEGIDLREDRLIGAIIVGTGLPQVCFERELLREHFAGQGLDGFDYAYRFPGMNKVLQAAGRVIRTQEDVGIVALLDERFLQGAYRRLFPREWNGYREVTAESVGEETRRFWEHAGIPKA